MDEEGVSMDEFKTTLQKGNLFASGIGKFSSKRTSTTAKLHELSRELW